MDCGNAMVPNLSASRLSFCSAMSFGFRMSGRLCKYKCTQNNIKTKKGTRQNKKSCNSYPISTEMYQNCPDDAQLPAPFELSLELLERQLVHLAPDVLLQGGGDSIIYCFNAKKNLQVTMILMVS